MSWRIGAGLSKSVTCRKAAENSEKVSEAGLPDGSSGRMLHQGEGRGPQQHQCGKDLFHRVDLLEFEKKTLALAGWCADLAIKRPCESALATVVAAAHV